MMTTEFFDTFPDDHVFAEWFKSTGWGDKKKKSFLSSLWKCVIKHEAAQRVWHYPKVSANHLDRYVNDCANG